MRLRLLALFVPLVAWWSRACAAEPDVSLFKATLPAPPAHLVVEANSAQNKYLMILDTGATYSWFEKQRTEVFLGSLGEDFARSNSVRHLPIETYQGLPMTLQGVTLKNDLIIQYDLTPLSRKIGRKLDGVLGMADLRSAKLLFDYETRTMEIHRGPWRLTGRDCRQEAIDEMIGLPMLRAKLAGHPRSFLIDSGSTSCLTLQSSLFNILVSEGVIDELQPGQALGFGGEYTSRRGRFRRGALMGKELAGVPVDTAGGDFSGASGAIGLGWMSGFIMEIALSDGKLRYRQIPRAEPPLDLENTLEASLSYTEGLPSIHITRPGEGPLTEAGLLPTDTIEKFGDLEAGRLDLASVTEFVGKHAGSEVPIRFKRKDGKVVETTVRLPPRVDLWQSWKSDRRSVPTFPKADSPGSMSRDKTSTETR